MLHLFLLFLIVVFRVAVVIPLEEVPDILPP
jgi:hypothetical protein